MFIVSREYGIISDDLISKNTLLKELKDFRMIIIDSLLSNQKIRVDYRGAITNFVIF